MSVPQPSFEAYPPEQFVVEVCSELPEELTRQRWRHVNVVLRLSMLAGLEMQLEATLNLLCDFASEIVPHDGALVYFWNENEEQVQARVSRGLERLVPESFCRGNLLNYWAARYARPLLINRGQNPQADACLDLLRSASALVLPLFVQNRVVGTVQLFSRRWNAFCQADAQLLWVLALVSESLLTRQYANEGLIRYAFTDFLTGLKTRGYFEQQLEMEIKRSERKKQQLALLMIDIDHFKPLNDNYGHHIGDQVLRDVAALLVKDMREVDTVARYGGEEFVIVLPETGGQGALLVADRLRRSVEQARFFAGAPKAVERLTISVGIAVFDSDAQFKSELIQRADTALYAAKAEGRNRSKLYSDVARQRREAS